MTLLKEVRKKRIYQSIVDQINQLIREGGYNPGDKLPSEREMAAAFGVSRAAVREAMSVLESMGIVQVKPGSGITLKEKPGLGLAGPVLGLLLTERESVLELLEVRSALESQAARLAAERGAPREIAAIEDAFARMEEEVRASRLAVEEDYRFHYAIAEAAHNRVLLRVMNAISDLYRKTLEDRRERALRVPGRPETTLEEHREILKAIRAGDPERASAAMWRHLENVRQRMISEDGYAPLA